MNAAARAAAYLAQTGRTACTLSAFWTNEDGTRGFEMRCGVTFDGVPSREAVDDLESAHRCDLTPRQARRARHKNNRELRRAQAAAELLARPETGVALDRWLHEQHQPETPAAAPAAGEGAVAAAAGLDRASRAPAPPQVTPRPAHQDPGKRR